jgi:hypothetical protein
VVGVQRRWNTAVTASAAVVVLVALLIGVGWIASLRSKTTTYRVTGPLNRVDVVLNSGQAVIVGTSASDVQVRRTDHFSFGHAAVERRALRGGVLKVDSSCPRIVLGSCSASYELTVPETVAVSVVTADGDVRVTGFRGDAAVKTRSGSVDVEAYCGFALSASSGAGNVRVAAACSPQRLDLRTGSGNAVALVPPGRYRVSTSSGSGREHISGVTNDRRALFSIDAHSGSGSVTVRAGP